jgi:hypothetical protein
MPFLFQIPRVLIVMTVDAQELPITPIRRVVIVVVILVMNRELTKSFACKFTPAPCTDPRINFERFLPVFLFSLLSAAPGIGKHLARFAFICFCFF